MAVWVGREPSHITPDHLKKHHLLIRRRDRELHEAEFFVVTAAVVGAAAGEARNAAAEGADAADVLLAGGATVKVPGADLAAREGKVVAALFIGEAEVDAGLLPFGAVGRDAAAACAVVRQEVGEFVAEGFVDFGVAEREELRVQCDELLPVVGETGGGAHAGVPAHADTGGKRLAAEGAQEVAGPGGECGVVAF